MKTNLHLITREMNKVWKKASEDVTTIHDDIKYNHGLRRSSRIGPKSGHKPIATDEELAQKKD